MFSAVVAAAVSLLLISFGLALAFDQAGLATRVANVIAGQIPEPHPTDDRLWSTLPLSLGLGQVLWLILSPLSGVAGAIAVGLSVAIYYVAMMRLAWLYTPRERRRVGPMFWTMRAAAIPLALFFSCALVLIFGMSVAPSH